MESNKEIEIALVVDRKGTISVESLQNTDSTEFVLEVFGDYPVAIYDPKTDSYDFEYVKDHYTVANIVEFAAMTEFFNQEYGNTDKLMHPGVDDLHVFERFNEHVKLYKTKKRLAKISKILLALFTGTSAGYFSIGSFGFGILYTILAATQFYCAFSNPLSTMEEDLASEDLYASTFVVNTEEEGEVRHRWMFILTRTKSDTTS